MSNESQGNEPVSSSVPQEQPAVRTTIVGGRPPGSGTTIGEIPRGIEVLVKKASVDSAFAQVLLDRRAEAANEIGLILESTEVAMLNLIPRAQLQAVIANTKVDDRRKPAFLGKVAAVMLAALGATYVEGFADQALYRGLKAVEPSSQPASSPATTTSAPSSEPASQPAVTPKPVFPVAGAPAASAADPDRQIGLPGPLKISGPPAADTQPALRSDGAQNTYSAGLTINGITAGTTSAPASVTLAGVLVESQPTYTGETVISAGILVRTAGISPASEPVRPVAGITTFGVTTTSEPASQPASASQPATPPTVNFGMRPVTSSAPAEIPRDLGVVDGIRPVPSNAPAEVPQRVIIRKGASPIIDNPPPPPPPTSMPTSMPTSAPSSGPTSGPTPSSAPAVIPTIVEPVQGVRQVPPTPPPPPVRPVAGVQPSVPPPPQDN